MKRFAVFAVATALTLSGGGVAMAVDGKANATDAHAENPLTAQGVCAKCHVPHGGKGDKIWAKSLATFTDFDGVTALCNSCHFSGGTGTYYTVFQPGIRMNHVMHTWADTAGATISPAYQAAVFPLNTTDGTFLNFPWVNPDPMGGTTDSGFYCGSCHNPHKQPFSAATGVCPNPGEGDYLRTGGTSGSADMTAFGLANARTGACTQCHATVATGTVSTGHNANCSRCHDPHEGQNLPDGAGGGEDSPDDWAQKILVINVTGGTAFVAQPNVPGFTVGSQADMWARLCFGCHQSATGAAQGSLPLGSGKVISNGLEHHPMGTNAPNAGDQGDHAPAYTGGELTCAGTSGCHTIHDAGQDYYIKATLTYAAQDDPAFCNGCHNQNTMAGMGAADGDDHRRAPASFVDGAPDTGEHGNCQFCHYIHNNTANAAASPGLDASEDALMAKDAVAGQWADITDTDTISYEDMCFACHFNTTITGAAGSGSFFPNTGGTADAFSHKTNAVPNGAAGGTLELMVAAALPVWGDGNATLHEYSGTGGANGAGEVSCLTCHVVHVQQGGDEDGNYFRNVNNVAGATGTERSGLCADCHGVAPMDATGSRGEGTGAGTAAASHPVGTAAPLPNTPYTAGTIPGVFGNGGDGYIGGRVAGRAPGSTGDFNTASEMQCETCHNFHRAATSVSGSLVDDTTVDYNGKLMVESNAGSTMCDDCHASY